MDDRFLCQPIDILPIVVLVLDFLFVALIRLVLKIIIFFLIRRLLVLLRLRLVGPLDLRAVVELIVTSVVVDAAGADACAQEVVVVPIDHRVAEDNEVLDAVVVTDDDHVLDLVLAGAGRSRWGEDLVVVSLYDEVLNARRRPDLYLVVVTIDAQVVDCRLEHALVHVVVVHSNGGGRVSLGAGRLARVVCLLVARVVRGLLLSGVVTLVVVR